MTIKKGFVSPSFVPLNVTLHASDAGGSLAVRSVERGAEAVSTVAAAHVSLYGNAIVVGADAFGSTCPSKCDASKWVAQPALYPVEVHAYW